MVTIEDAIEQIVGEIADEYDEALVDGIKVHERDLRRGPGPRADSTSSMRDSGLSLPEDQDFDTVGGFIFHELGRIPVPAKN